MAWAQRIDPHYGMMMTDGYISSSDMAEASRGSHSKSVEVTMAKHFFQLNTKPRGPPGRRYVPSPLHVWVIGNDVWLNQPAAQTGLFQNIHEGVKDENYRMVVVGSGWPAGCYVGDWKGWLWQAGMRKKKRHFKQNKCKEYGGILLELMFDHYHEKREAPSVVLDRFGVPYAFYGDKGSRREE